MTRWHQFSRIVGSGRCGTERSVASGEAAGNRLLRAVPGRRASSRRGHGAGCSPRGSGLCTGRSAWAQAPPSGLPVEAVGFIYLQNVFFSVCVNHPALIVSAATHTGWNIVCILFCIPFLKEPVSSWRPRQRENREAGTGDCAVRSRWP